MSRAPMNTNDLFFRSIAKSMENCQVEVDTNVKTIVIPVQYKQQDLWTVLNLIFKSTLDITKGEFTITQKVELFDNTQRKEEDKVSVEMNSFLYMMRLNDEHFEAMEFLKDEINKKLAFGKRELNNLRKEAGLPKEIGAETEAIAE